MSETKPLNAPCAVVVKDKRKQTAASRATQFKPGNKLGGRKHGSRDKLNTQFWDDIHADWAANGAVALAEAREKDPVAYCRIVAMILPKDVKIEHTGNMFVKVWQALSDDIIPQTVIDAGAEDITEDE